MENIILLKIQKFFSRTPEKVKKKNQRHYVALMIASFFAIITHSSWILFFGYLGVKPLAYFNIISVSIWIFAYFLNRRGFHYLSYNFMMLEVYLHQTLCVIFIGWAAGFQYLILLVIIGAYLLPHGHNFNKFIIVSLGFLNYSILDYLYRTAFPLYILNTSVIKVFNYSNILIFVLLISLALYLFNGIMYKFENALLDEQKKVNNAYSLLSKYVAPQLAETILVSY